MATCEAVDYARGVFAILGIRGGFIMRRLVFSLCLSLPMLAHAADVRGLWVGYYAYEPGTAAIERVESAMVLEQIDTEVGGSMIERQTFGEELFPGLPSDLINGVMEGGALVFDKYYVHDEDGTAYVTYKLSLSPDGNVLSGFWSLGEMHGTALFRRVTADSAERIPAPR